MKKLFVYILVSVLSASALAGCHPNVETSVSTPQSSAESAVSTEESSEPEEESQKSEDESDKSDESGKGESSEESEKTSEEESTDSSDNSENSEESEESEESSEEESEESDEESSEEEESESESSEESSEEDDKNDIFSFGIQLNGIDFKIPCDYSEFTELGYTIDADDELEGGKYTLGVNPKNEEGEYIIAQLWNPTSSPKSYSECQIGSVEIKLGDGIRVVLPGDFEFDESVTPESVKEQYGEPESEHISEKYVTLRYKKDIYRTVEFFIYTDLSMSKYTSVTVKNFV